MLVLFSTFWHFLFYVFYSTQKLIVAVQKCREYVVVLIVFGKLKGEGEIEQMHNHLETASRCRRTMRRLLWWRRTLQRRPTTPRRSKAKGTQTLLPLMTITAASTPSMGGYNKVFQRRTPRTRLSAVEMMAEQEALLDEGNDSLENNLIIKNSTNTQYEQNNKTELEQNLQ